MSTHRRSPQQSFEAALSNAISGQSGESITYLLVSRENIRHSHRRHLRAFSGLFVFGIWTENPRVGGSIPPLATIQIIRLRQSILLRVCAGAHLVPTALEESLESLQHQHEIRTS